MDESRVVIEGAAARAVAVAHAAFVEAVPDAAIDRYEVVVRTGDDTYAVTFLPKLAEGERPQRGGGTSLGPEWSAQVSRTDFSITRQGFAR